MLIISYYLHYVYCCNFLDFNSIGTIVELGGGAGKQVEVIKKLHPHIRFLLFDIVPPLYVAQRYLQTVFPDDVISYRETRKMTSIPEIGERKILIFGNWQFPLLENVKIDLFWNASSFQEMEPDIVGNYLHYVNSQADSVYLQELMGGSHVGRPGKFGVLTPTTLKDYEKGLDNFRLLDLSPSRGPFGRALGGNEDSDSFWLRNVC